MVTAAGVLLEEAIRFGTRIMADGRGASVLCDTKEVSQAYSKGDDAGDVDLPLEAAV